MSARRGGLVAVAGGTAVLLAGVLASCFSERVTAAPGGDVAGACEVGDISTLTGAGRAVVVIRDFAFHPDTLRVPAGTTVTWLNCDAKAGVPHTTTADAGAWDSPLLDAGATYQHAFPSAGRFGYHCNPHPFMKGAVVVQ